jgi:hypothetical protein
MNIFPLKLKVIIDRNTIEFQITNYIIICLKPLSVDKFLLFPQFIALIRQEERRYKMNE